MPGRWVCQSKPQTSGNAEAKGAVSKGKRIQWTYALPSLSYVVGKPDYRVGKRCSTVAYPVSDISEEIWRTRVNAEISVTPETSGAGGSARPGNIICEIGASAARRANPAVDVIARRTLHHAGIGERRTVVSRSCTRSLAPIREWVCVGTRGASKRTGAISGVCAIATIAHASVRHIRDEVARNLARRHTEVVLAVESVGTHRDAKIVVGKASETSGQTGSRAILTDSRPRTSALANSRRIGKESLGAKLDAGHIEGQKVIGCARGDTHACRLVPKKAV